jgi:hypothetical protein
MKNLFEKGGKVHFFITEIVKYTPDSRLIFNIISGVIIADELIHLCGVLSHSLRRKEPSFAKSRANIKLFFYRVGKEP